MKKEEINALFEVVKSSPTELSVTEVKGFIETIPGLPAPKPNWFKNFNLNSIMMTTTAIAVATSLVLWLSGTHEQKDLAPATSPSLIEVETPNESDPVLKSKENPESEPEPEPEAAEPTSEEENAGNDMVLVISSEPEIPEAVETNEMEANSTADVNVMNRYRGDAPQEWSTTTLPPQGPEVYEKVQLSNAQLRSLKRKITQYMKDDLLYEKDAMFNTFEYTSNKVVANGELLTGEVQSKYTVLMSDYGIKPAPFKKVVFSPKFIQVGDFYEEGFSGMALGKKMEIYFIDKNAVEVKSLFKDSEKPGKLDGLIIKDLAEDQAKPDDIFMKAEGKTKDSEVNLSLLNRLLGRKNDKKDQEEFQGVFNTGDRAISFYDADTKLEHINLSSKRLIDFKKRLYTLLIDEGLVQKRNSPVRLQLEPKAYELNNTVKLSDSTNFKINRLLKEYNIPQQKDLKVLMNKDFILVGRFVKRGFFGSVNGQIDSSNVKNTLFEEDLRKVGMFGN